MIKLFKFFLFIIIFFLLQSKTFACDTEEKKVSFQVITNSKNNLREKACKNSKKLWLTKIWEKYDVIADSWEYYKVLINWKENFIYKDWVNIVQEKNVSEEVIAKNSENQEQFDFNRKIWEYWLELYNNERRKLWLKEYSYNLNLQKSALVWSELSAKKWKIDHKRNKNDSYYDFWKIQNWFKKNGVDCKIKNWLWAVENIWYGFMTCQNGDCLEETKKEVKKTFDMYLREKWKKNNAHYKSIVSKDLAFLGFWVHKINVWKNKFKVYNTTHFCPKF